MSCPGKGILRRERAGSSKHASPEMVMESPGQQGQNGPRRLLPEGAAPVQRRSGTMTNADVTDNRESLGGVVTTTPVCPRPAGSGPSGAASGPAHYFGTDCDKLAAFCPCLSPQLHVGRVRGQALLPDQDALRLLDDRPGVQRTLQLLR
jgi:hypothetical protein